MLMSSYENELWDLNRRDKHNGKIPCYAETSDLIIFVLKYDSLLRICYNTVMYNPMYVAIRMPRKYVLGTPIKHDVYDIYDIQ